MNRNNDLTTTVTQLKANQEKMNGGMTRLPKHTTAMIEDMVQKFYEKKFKIASEFNEKRTSELTKQVSDLFFKHFFGMCDFEIRALGDLILRT